MNVEKFSHQSLNWHAAWRKQVKSASLCAQQILLGTSLIMPPMQQAILPLLVDM
jgi:hypothetical protein